MTNDNPFQEERDQEQENAENQPALRMPKVNRQRDMGSGLDAGTAPGTTPGNAYQNPGGKTVGPGADPHGGAGDGSGLTTGQYRGSDEGTTTEPGAGSGGGDNVHTDLARNQQTMKGYRPHRANERDRDKERKDT